MASTLRSRLWISYLVVIFVALCLVALGLVVTLQQNPVLYRQTVQRLYLAGEFVKFRLEEFPRLASEREDKILEREAEARKLRMVILNQDGTVVAQSGSDSDASLPKITPPLKTSEIDSTQAKTFRDSKGITWIYTLHALQNQRLLLVATQLTPLKPREIFRDEILGPFLQAALVALLLAVGLSLFVGQWISNPLKKMAQSARKMEVGDYHPIPIEGPREVQQLGEALNEMAHKVRQSQQSQRDFVANVSHELKTPLTSIQGFAQAILDGAVQTPQALKQSAGVIYAESGRMYRLVMDLLSLAKLEAGTADLRRQNLDLVALLRSVVDKFALQAQQEKLELTADLTPLPAVIGDGDRIAQVFTNLVDNALKFTPAGGRVTIQGRYEDGAVIVKVIDTGVGIAPEDQARIFERFYQVDKSRKGGRGRGVGLGLAIASQILVAHNGRIWLESQVGKGSIFTVRLPANFSQEAARENS